jgi:hypothetical protein
MSNIAVYIVNKTYPTNHIQTIFMYLEVQMDSFVIMSKTF